MTEFVLFIFLTIANDESRTTNLNTLFPITFATQEECINVTRDDETRTHLYRYLTEVHAMRGTIVDMRMICSGVSDHIKLWKNNG
jgi:hypothetical protein